MTKEEILQTIKEIAAKNDGKAPGAERFSTVTGIRRSEWYPDLWLRWSDALNEAGLEANAFQEAYEQDFLVQKYIEIIQELGHFPIEGELAQKRKSDSNFPSRDAFRQLGSKLERAQKVMDYCHGNKNLEDIICYCEKVIESSRDKTGNNVHSNEKIGYVYLIRHGSRNEYKIGRTYNPIRREGEIRLELPDKIKPIHYIETDDPAGIESYWHSRFADKRKEGEWFSLSADDVRAFKRWRKIY